MTYRTGSDEQQHIQSRALRGGLPPRASTRALAGIRHAVPEDSDVAVCGTRPAFLWPQPWPGGLGSVTDLCPACVEHVGPTSPP